MLIYSDFIILGILNHNNNDLISSVICYLGAVTPFLGIDGKMASLSRKNITKDYVLNAIGVRGKCAEIQWILFYILMC